MRGRIHASIQTDGSLAEIFAEGENLDIVMMRNGENSGEGSTAIVGNDPSSSRTEVKEVHKEEKNEGDFPCIGTSVVKIPMLMTRVRRRNICLLRILRSLCWKRRRRKPLISNCNLIIVAILIDKLNNFFFVTK